MLFYKVFSKKIVSKDIELGSDKNISGYKKIYWISLYLTNFLKNYINWKVYWQFINLNLKKKKTHIFFLWKYTFRNFLVKEGFLQRWHYFYILIQLLFFKNPKMLTKLLTRFISKLKLKLHKRYFRFVNKILLTFYNYLYKKKLLLGYKLYFKGKLGRKGSVKKSTIRYTVGRTSFTNKSLRFNYNQFLIYTETGVVGAYLALFY